MSEDFLQYIWKFQLYNTKKLLTVSGLPFEVINQGTLNHNAGPDFLEGRVKVDNVIWNGSIEIHIKSSDWEKHKHQFDKKYRNVILHVVWEDDKPIYRDDKTLIPTFELKYLVQRKLIEDYNKFIQNSDIIKCSSYLNKISSLTLASTIERAIIGRVEKKSDLFATRLLELNNNWEQLIFEKNSMVFGLKINAHNFEELAKNIPLSILQKHRGNLLQVESILFGMAGYLDESFEDKYYQSLKKEYLFLKKKYRLASALEKHHWNFSRLRPSAFPTVRIALLASFINKFDSLFSFCIEAKSSKELYSKIEIAVSEYWETHYVFGKKSKSIKKVISKKLIDLMIINVFVPIYYLYAEKKNLQEFKNLAISFLENLPSESNSITKKWVDLGLQNKSAMDSQALIELYNESCSRNDCLNCPIGVSILKK